MAGDLTLDEVCALIARHKILRIAEIHPAAYDFELGDSSILTLYPGDRDYPDTWRLR